MTLHAFSAETSPSLVNLDANFSTLANLLAPFQVSGGNVGIGKSPTSILDVQAASVSNGAVAFTLTNTQSSTSVGINVTGTTFAAAGVAGSSILIGPGSGNTGIAIGQYTAGTGGIQFLTNGAENARVDSTGKWMIGYTSSNGSYKLQVNSQIFATSSTVATSDGRYKQDVRPIEGASAMLAKLNPVTFAWKPHPVHEFVTGRVTGFIAQEVREALASTDFVDTLVNTGSVTLPDGSQQEFLGLAEGHLIAVLVASMKEMLQRIAVLEAH